MNTQQQQRPSLVRNALLTSLLTLPTAFLNTPEALADKSDFRVYNNSSVAITHLYASSSARDTWDNDILGRDILPSNSSIQVLFGNPSPSDCLYDIRAIFADGVVLEDYQINVCTVPGYTFYDN
jgi:hypothetical protein